MAGELAAIGTISFLNYDDHPAAMSEERRENRHISPVGKEPPPEPIYDLTKDDKTESVKAAGPRESGDEE
jgi:hypothetical protein